jgi:hypothetical protein
MDLRKQTKRCEAVSHARDIFTLQTAMPILDVQEYQERHDLPIPKHDEKAEAELRALQSWRGSKRVNKTLRNKAAVDHTRGALCV